MTRTSLRVGVFAAFGLSLTGCYGPTPEEESVAQVEQAVNVCNATPAANLIVDGIPAYDQCTASTNSAIFSNNGVDTATSAASSDWVRTQYSGGYQCTELVHRYWLFKWNITWIPNGNAGTWCNTTPPSTSGIVQTTTPVHGDAIVFAPGVCGASTTYGHVALVDIVDTAGSRVTYVEQNGAGRRTGAWSCATCFLHVVANTGSAGSSGTGGATSGTGGAGTSTGGATVGMGGATATGGRVNLGGGTSTATGGNATNTGGVATNTGGVAANTGGNATNTGGRAASGGSTVAATGGSNSSSTGGSPATGGSSPSNNGGQSSATGGVTGIGGANNVATGGANSTGTTPTASGGNAVGGEGTVATAGQGVLPGSGVPDPDAGCSCSVPRSNTSSRALGFIGLALALLWRRRRSQTAGPK